MEAVKAIYTKLARVMAGVGKVPKSGVNKHFNYNYATEADLLEEIRPLLAEQKIAFIPSVASVLREGDLTRVEMDFVFADSESGEAVTVKFFGEAKDTGDKGIYKAYTGGIKYCLMKLFLIPTGDDPENDEDKKTAGKSGEKAQKKPMEGTSGQAASATPPKQEQAQEDSLLPEKVVLNFGKHYNKTLGAVQQEDPTYIDWLVGNAKDPLIREAAKQLIKAGNGPDTKAITNIFGGIEGRAS